MALQKAALPIRLGPGIETKADAKGVPATRLLGLENGVFTKGISISKRHGYSALATSVLGEASAYDGARGLSARGSELVLFTDDRCYSYIEGASSWNDAGPCYSVAQSSRVLVKAPSRQTMGDYATASGIGISAWEDSRGGVWYAVLEDDRGRVTQGPAQASATGTRPRCVRVGDKLAVLWAEATLGQIRAIFIDPAEPHTFNSTLYPTVLVADLVTTQPGFDAAYLPTAIGPRAAAVIVWNAVTGIRFGVLDPSGVLGSPVTGWPSPVDEAPPAAVTVGPSLSQHITDSVALSGYDFFVYTYATATDVYLSTRYYDGTNLNVLVSGAATGHGAGADNLTCSQFLTEGAHRVDVWAEFAAAQTRNSTVQTLTMDGGGGAIGTIATIRGCSLASKAFTLNDQTLATVVHDVPLFGVYLTVRRDGFCVARTLPGIAGDTPARPHLPQVFASDDETFHWTAIYKTALESINDDQFTSESMTVVSLEFGASDSHQSAQAGSSLYLAGAAPMLYDGASWIEAAPHYGIDWNGGETLHTVSAGTGSIDAGTRAYVFWVEFDLTNGETIRGPVSKPYQVTTVLNDELTFAIPTLRITEMAAAMGGRTLKRANARMCVARTVAGDASSYYRCSSLNPSTEGSPNGHVSNVTTADTVAFVDRMSDTTLLTQEPLYTNGGILSNDPIPGARVIAGGKGRLFATEPSDDSIVRFSQERADGYAIEWPPELVFTVDPYGGPITGIAVLDDVVVVFKRSAIYIVGGAGPLANPEAGGGWSAPQLVTSDVGCVAQRSIATTPAGIVFQSAKGIYLLDRGRQVSYIGAPVEAYNAQTITRATLVEDTTQIRFLTSSGKTLLYDYFYQQWSTFTNHEGADAICVDGVYHYLRNDGRVFVEDSTGYSDAGQQITLVIETAWIKLQEYLQGFARIYHLLAIGERKSAHALRMQYQVDYDVGWSEPLVHDSNSAGGSVYGDDVYGFGVYGGSSQTLYQWRWYIGIRCESIRFRFTDREDAGVAGAAYELSELLITGGLIGPAYKLPAARSR